jgi:hypothetical protein
MLIQKSGTFRPERSLRWGHPGLSRDICINQKVRTFRPERASRRGIHGLAGVCALTERKLGYGDKQILKAYRTVRGGAAKHVTAALSALGLLVQNYAA